MKPDWPKVLSAIIIEYTVLLSKQVAENRLKNKRNFAYWQSADALTMSTVNPAENRQAENFQPESSSITTVSIFKHEPEILSLSGCIVKEHKTYAIIQKEEGFSLEEQIQLPILLRELLKQNNYSEATVSFVNGTKLV